MSLKEDNQGQAKSPPPMTHSGLIKRLGGIFRWGSKSGEDVGLERELARLEGQLAKEIRSKRRKSDNDTTRTIIEFLDQIRVTDRETEGRSYNPDFTLSIYTAPRKPPLGETIIKIALPSGTRINVNKVEGAAPAEKPDELKNKTQFVKTLL